MQSKISSSILVPLRFAVGFFIGLCMSASAAPTLQKVLDFSFVQQNPIGAPVLAGDGNYYVATHNDLNDNSAIVRITPAGTVATIYSFDNHADHGPAATPLTPGPDGALYGATKSSFFRVMTSGVFQTLATFDSGMGADVMGNLLFGSDGAIYAACRSGGANSEGSLLKWTAADGISLLASFDESLPTEPRTGLCRDADGNLYGCSGGSAIFRYNPSQGLSVLAVAGDPDSTEQAPYGSNLVMGPDGNIYLLTTLDDDFDGVVDHSTVYRVSTAGSVETVHVFGGDPTDGTPVWNPIFGSDGNLYGLNSGGAHNAGVAWRLTPGGQLTALNTFQDVTYANGAPLSLLQDGDFLAATGVSYEIPQGGNVFVLHSSDGSTDLLGTLGYSSPYGQGPNSALAVAPDGGVYGTSSLGGDLASGTLFHISPQGSAEVLSDFPNPGLSNWHPESGLVRGMDGNYYGMIALDCLFQYVPGGSLGLFLSGDAEGGDFPGFVLNLPCSVAGGDFYGTSMYGGDNGDGAIYKVSSTGAATVLASFDSQTTGFFPPGSLIQGTDGNFYGVCQYSDASLGSGTVFKATSAGALSLVAAFDYDTTGAEPVGPLVQAADGNFYGVTTSGGPNNGVGTIFRVTPAGVLTRVASFDDALHGGSPNGLTLGADGLLYGTTGTDGPLGGGTLFKATLNGQITVLAAFDPSVDGSATGQVLQTPDGSLYVPLQSAIVRYRDSSPAPNPTPLPTPPAAPKIKGKTKTTTDAPKITITGTLGTAGAYVEFRLGNGKFLKAKGGKSWKFTTRIKPGKNTIFIRSYDPATGLTSTLKKFIVFRR